MEDVGDRVQMHIFMHSIASFLLFKKIAAAITMFKIYIYLIFSLLVLLLLYIIQ